MKGEREKMARGKKERRDEEKGETFLLRSISPEILKELELLSALTSSSTGEEEGKEGEWSL